MLTIVIEGLVRSPQNKSVHYRQPHRHVTVEMYVCTKLSNETKACIQNALRVLECKLEDVDATT